MVTRSWRPLPASGHGLPHAARGLGGATAVSSDAEGGVGVESVAIQTSIGSGNRVGLWPRLGEGPRGPTRREAGQEGRISPLDWPV